jgi:hypothetical protein
MADSLRFNGKSYCHCARRGVYSRRAQRTTKDAAGNRKTVTNDRPLHRDVFCHFERGGRDIPPGFTVRLQERFIPADSISGFENWPLQLLGLSSGELIQSDWAKACGFLECVTTDEFTRRNNERAYPRFQQWLGTKAAYRAQQKSGLCTAQRFRDNPELQTEMVRKAVQKIKSAPIRQRNCQVCGNLFSYKEDSAIHCSKKCTARAWRLRKALTRQSQFED